MQNSNSQKSETFIIRAIIAFIMVGAGLVLIATHGQAIKFW